MIFDNAGNLYGTAASGGPGGEGIIFELLYSTGWTETTLYSFSFLGANNGGFPYAGLISDLSGNLYGAASLGGMGGGGMVFKMTPSSGSWTLSTIYTFTGQWGPVRSLTMDGAGNLYGTTREDGAYGNVFKLTPSGDGWTYTSLHDFTGGGDGGFPSSSVTFDANGNLYGTTYRGGATGSNCDNQCGVIWEITP